MQSTSHRRRDKNTTKAAEMILINGVTERASKISSLIWTPSTDDKFVGRFEGSTPSECKLVEYFREDLLVHPNQALYVLLYVVLSASRS
jgi:hypothetical protein